MKSAWIRFCANKYFYTTLSIVALVAYGFVVYAAPTVTYNPGETLDPTDPNCHADNTCVVVVPGATIGGSVIGGTPNQVLYTDANGNVTGDSLFVRDAGQGGFTIESNLANNETAKYYQGNNMLGIGLSGAGTFFKTSSPGVNTFMVMDITPFGGAADATFAGYFNPFGNGNANMQTLFDGTTGQAQVLLVSEDGTGAHNATIQLGADSSGSSIKFSFDSGGSGYTFPTTNPGAGQVLGYVGPNALGWLTMGGGGGLIGYTDTNNTALGINTALTETGVENTFIGIKAGASLGTGNDNVFVGFQAGGSSNAVNMSESVIVGVQTSGYAWGGSNNFVAVGINTISASGIGDGAVALGSNAHATDFNAIALGITSTASGNSSIAIGNGANATANHSIAMGYASSTVGHTNSIALGSGATITDINQMVVGSQDYAITDFYFGGGVINTVTPSGTTIHATGGTGTNVKGGSLIFNGGQSTGNQNGGDLMFQVSPAGAFGLIPNTQHSFLQLGANKISTLGDVEDAFSGVKIIVDNYTGRDVIMGNIGGAGGNGTNIVVSDADRRISFNYGASSYTFPLGHGTAGQVMVDDGTGALAWTNPSGDNCGSDVCFITDGASNMYAGLDSGSFVTANGGYGNLFIGISSGHSTTNGGYNTFYGNLAGQTNIGGQRNTFNGYAAGNTNNTGSDNTFVGFQSGYVNSGGAYNTLIGSYAGFGSTGDNNVGIGYGTGFASGASNAIALGYGAVASDNQFALPDAVTDVKWSGVTYTLPSVQGTSGSYLKNDGSGVLTWDQIVAYSFSVVNTNMWVPIGGSGGALTTGTGNFFTGFAAGAANSSGLGNTFVGAYAGNHLTDGYGNTFMGANAGKASAHGVYNTFVGGDAGAKSTGNGNIGVGSAALYNLVSGGENVALGNSAGQGITGGNGNIFIGSNTALSSGTAISDNVFIGQSAGTNTAANRNIFIGKSAGVTNTLGTDNIILGVAGDVNANNWNKSIGIGNDVLITKSNQFVVGSTTSPITEMDIIGGFTGGGCSFTISGMACSSDERLKTDVTDLPATVLDDLQNIRTVTYRWNNDQTGSIHIGFLAQNIQKIFPELVSVGANGYLQVNYAAMTPVLTQAIREMNLKINNIDAQATLIVANKTFLDGLVTWLGDATNGIGKLFVHEVHTDTLCVGATCVTEAELQHLLQNQAVVTTPVTTPVTSSPGIPTDTVPDPGSNTAPVSDPAVTNPAPTNDPVVTPNPVIDTSGSPVVPDAAPAPSV